METTQVPETPGTAMPVDKMRIGHTYIGSNETYDLADMEFRLIDWTGPHSNLDGSDDSYELTVEVGAEVWENVLVYVGSTVHEQD